LLTEEPDKGRYDKALLELRKLIEELDIKTRAGAGRNENFYAYLNEENGFLSDGVYIWVSTAVVDRDLCEATGP
jgi:hypothetical protein